MEPMFPNHPKINASRVILISFLFSLGGISLLTWIKYQETGSVWPIRWIKELRYKVDDL
jgi:hypothetical protein